LPTDLRQRKDAARKAQTRRKLLDAAAAVFARDGFHGPRISDIVGAAGVGQGTFYRYFDSKRAIFDALFDRLLEELLAEFQPMSEQLPRDLAEYRRASRAVVGRLAAVLERERALVLLLLRQGASIDADFAAKLNRTTDRFAQMARFYLDHAIDRGFARPCDAGLVARGLVGMALHLLERWLDDGLEGCSAEAVVDEMVEFAFAGFGPRSNGQELPGTSATGGS